MHTEAMPPKLFRGIYTSSSSVRIYSPSRTTPTELPPIFYPQKKSPLKYRHGKWHGRFLNGNMCLTNALDCIQGSIFSAIGSAINSIISAIASVIETVISAIVTVSVPSELQNFLAVILSQWSQCRILTWYGLFSRTGPRRDLELLYGHHLLPLWFAQRRGSNGLTPTFDAPLTQFPY